MGIYNSPPWLGGSLALPICNPQFAMYKLLLSWRYLRTRYIALASIISVTLGDGTLIVVNSVMAGFSTKLMERVHGQLSDITVAAPDLDGFPDPAEKMERIRNSAVGKYVRAMSPTMEVFAMLQFHFPNGERVIRAVRLVGIDAKTRDQVGGFKQHLVNQKTGPEAGGWRSWPVASSGRD